jgi:hypothetical protein
MKSRQGRKRAQKRTRRVGRAETQRDVVDERAAGLTAGAEDDKGWEVGRAKTEKNKWQPSKPLDTCNRHRVHREAIVIVVTGHVHCSMTEMKQPARNIRDGTMSTSQTHTSYQKRMHHCLPFPALPGTPNVEGVTSPLHNNLRDTQKSIVHFFLQSLSQRPIHRVSKPWSRLAQSHWCIYPEKKVEGLTITKRFTKGACACE